MGGCASVEEPQHKVILLTSLRFPLGYLLFRDTYLRLPPTQLTIKAVLPLVLNQW